MKAFDYPRQSRVHRLKSFDTPQATVYVKREDELGFGISGSKIRKYSTLLPHLVAQKVEEAVVLGGLFSNHVVSITQLLKEEGISATLFLKGTRPEKVVGNFLWANLLLSEESIHYFPGKSLEEIKHSAEAYALEKAKEGKKIFIIPPGGSHPAALVGLLSLALDLIRNEKTHSFDHILLDSGTGMTAAVLVLAYAYLRKKTQFHLLLLAGSKEEFHQELEKWKILLEELVGELVPPPLFTLYLPQNAASFGSVNRAVLESIKELARNEGILTDPVYTGKLFLEGKRILSSLKGSVLFIHTGGGLGLTGFQEDLLKIL